MNEQRRIIDLSHPISDGMPVYPGDPPVEFVVTSHIKDTGYTVTRVSMGSHTGTHVDAPRHCIYSDKTVDMLPLDVMVGWAEVLDLGDLEPGTDIVSADLDKFADRLEPNSRVLLKTGWRKRFGDPAFFESFPGLTEGAVMWLNARNVRLLGIEQPSVHLREHEAVHKALLDVGVVLIESVANLDQVTADRVYLVALPLNLTGGDGAPVRMIAIESRQEG